MPIEIQCPECRATLRIADENVGKNSRCPSCSSVFIANEPTAKGSGNEIPASNPLSASSRPTDSRATDSSEVGRGQQFPLEKPFRDPLADTERQIGSEKVFAREYVDETNPYSPASSQFVDDETPEGITPTIISIDAVANATWSIFKKHWAMSSVAVIIVTGVNYGLSFIQNIFVVVLESAAGFDPMIVVGVQLLIGAIGWVVGLWVQMGQTMVMLDIARGKPIELSRVFAAGPFLLPGVGAMLAIICILGLLLAVVVGIPAGTALMLTTDVELALSVALGTAVIASIPFIILSIGFSMSQMLVVDQQLGPWESVATSWHITKGNRLSLFMLGLLMSAVSFVALIVGLLALCVGVLPAMIGVGALASLLLTVSYLSMTGQRMVIPEVNTVRG